MCDGVATVRNAATYILAGGGTGGHLFPGIAVAEKILAHDDSARIVFVGSEREIDHHISQNHGFEHHVLPAVSTKVARRNPIRFVWRNWRAIRLAKLMLQQITPSAVIGLGGFASVPVVLAAKHLKIPTLLLEQNVLPGRANRWLCRRASMICLSFEQSADYLSKCGPFCVTGNPVRQQIAAMHCQSAQFVEKATPTLLILGGSQGAVALNEAMLPTIQALRKALNGWKVVHQTGRQQVELVRNRYSAISIDSVVEPFFADVSQWYRRANIVVSRGGATTLAELACAGVPAILVPFPHAAENHQWLNARVFSESGAARIVEQTPNRISLSDRLISALTDLQSDQALYQRMQRAMKSLACPNAAQAVTEQLFALAKVDAQLKYEPRVHLRTS